MAYATVQDMIDAYGENELVQLSSPDGADMGAVNAPRVQQRLDEAADQIDSYLRRRYRVPVTTNLVVLRRCCCDIARKLLSQTGSTDTRDQVAAAAKHQFDWLRDISEGRATLEGAAPAGPLSGARVTDRPAMIRSGGPLFCAGRQDRNGF